MSVWEWSRWLPEIPEQFRVDIGAGNTPLVRSRRIGPASGLDRLYFKVESGNPTGSYKDRYATVAVSNMLATGRTRCVATSSGNSGAALAAHCAAAGITCEIAVIITSPSGKLQQMRAYGATIYRIEGFGVDLEISARTYDYLTWLGKQPGASLEISAYACSPVGMEGVKTISYELQQQCPGPIDHVFCPAGSGGLTLAVARGFEDLVAGGTLPKGPRIECVQPEGNNTIADPLNEGADRARTVECTTKMSGLQCPSILDGHEVIPVVRRSGGLGHLVSDEQAWAAQARLISEEGIYCEPAGAVALAGALNAAREGRIKPEAQIVCLVTGSGFKDPPSIDRMLQGQDLSTRQLPDVIDESGAPV